MATITTIPNGVSGLTFRQTMNDNFDILNNEKSEVTHNHNTEYATLTSVATNTTNISANTTAIGTNTSAISALDTRITVLENTVDPTVSIVSGARTSQTIIADTPTILEWMQTVVVDDGGSAITYDLPTHSILINEAGIYRVFGTINITAPINDVVSIELYIDNLPTGYISTAIGRGTTTTIGFINTFLYNFNINDDIDLYVTSSGTEVTVKSASVTIEKTNH